MGIKYYGLPNQNVVELYGRMGTRDYYKRSSQRRDSPVRNHNTRVKGAREKIKGQKQVVNDQPLILRSKTEVRTMYY